MHLSQPAQMKTLTKNKHIIRQFTMSLPIQSTIRTIKCTMINLRKTMLTGLSKSEELKIMGTRTLWTWRATILCKITPTAYLMTLSSRKQRWVQSAWSTIKSLKTFLKLCSRTNKAVPIAAVRSTVVGRQLCPCFCPWHLLLKEITEVLIYHW